MRTEIQRTSLRVIGVVVSVALGMAAASGQDATPGETPPPTVSVAAAMVRGTITDSQGPVAGATVLIEVSDMSIRRVVFKTRARTDAQGRYEADLSSVDAASLGIQVNAVDKRHTEGMQIEITEKSALPIEIAIELKPGMSVTGHVYSDAGKPLPAAQVEVPYVRPVETEFDGFFTVLGVPLAQKFTILAKADGFSPQTRLVEVTGDGVPPEVDFHLKPERIVHGRVTDADGRSVEGAEVNIYLPLQRAWRRSDSNGEFSVGDLPYEASKGLIVASHPDYAPYKQETVIGEGNTTVTIHLDRGGVVEGQVTDNQGNAVVGASVALSLPDAMPQPLDRTDSAGKFRAANLPPGDVVVTVSPPGKETLQRNGELLVEHSGTRLNGNVDPWPDQSASDFTGTVDKGDVTLKRRDRASGEEAKADTPITAEYTGKVSTDGLEMRGTYSVRKGQRTGTWQVTRENGAATDLSGLWTWKETLDPVESKVAPARKKIQVAKDEKATVDLALAAGWTLEGTVVDGEKKPVEDARVSVLLWDKSPVELESVRSDPSGKFRIENLPTGELVVRAMKGEVGVRTLTFAKPPEDKAAQEFVLAWTDVPAGGGLGKAEDMFANSPEVGTKAPPFTAQALDGSAIDLAKLQGKVVLLDFWASWCGPCVAELPVLRRVYSRFGQQADFVMVSVSLDFNEADLRGAIKEYGITWLQIFDGKGWEAEVGKKYGVMAIPRVFLLDRKGNVIGNNLRGEAILQAVEDALKGP